MTHRLSKSRVLSGLQCPKRLYLEVNQPELADEQSGAGHLLALGQEVGEMARRLHPGGTLIPYDLGLSLAVARTREILDTPLATPLFEGTFERDGVLIRADVLTPADNGMNLKEVKASASVKDYHYPDCAVQSWVLEGAGYRLDRIYLSHVDSTFVYAREGEYGGLLKDADITEVVRQLRADVPSWIRLCREALSGDMPQVEPGEQCSTPHDCPFQRHCWPKGPDFPVTSLPNKGRIVAELLQEGITDIREIPEGRLQNALKERVRQVVLSGEPFLDPEGKSALARLAYPRFYLDFETVQFAVPIWLGTSPYQQLPFQWSCHVEETPGRFRHQEFLDSTGSPPMRKFTETLLHALGDNGPVFMYSKYERTQLRAMASMFPDLAPSIDAVVARLEDLQTLTKAYYYHPDMHGSWSIKMVLPTIAPELDYARLNEVHDGNEAQTAYREIIAPETPEETRQQSLTNLLRYCELDTLAMVRIAHYLEGREGQYPALNR